MSTSGYVVRPSLMNRSNSSSWRIGSTRVIPSTYATIESAALPRPCAGICARLREPHEVPADQEELREPGLLDHVQLVGQLAHDRRRHRVVAASRALPAQLTTGALNGVSPSGTGKPGNR